MASHVDSCDLTWFLAWFRLVPNWGHAGPERWKVYVSLRKTKESEVVGGWFLPWFGLVPAIVPSATREPP